jgi:hypothetical protein
MSGRGRLLLVMLPTLGCEQDFRAPLDLDEIEEPTGSCVTVIHESLEPGLALHQYVADAPNSAGGWALATILNEVLNQPELALVRVPATPDEAPTEPIELGFSNLASTRIELRGGAAPGELWLLQESDTSASLRKLAPGFGVIAGNGSLSNFPAEEGNGACPAQFHRQLLLLEGRPYVLALPDCSDSTALDLQLLELDPDSLVFTSAWVLSFDPCTTDPQCGLYPYTLTPIRGGESTHVANAERVAVGFTQVRDFGNGLTSAGVSLLDLELDADAPNARLITFREVWFTPTQLGPVHLGEDLFSTQLHVRNGGSEQDAALLRFDVLGELYIQIKAPHLPLGGRGRLVQLATQSAMIDVDDGALVVVPLVDVASWPIWEPTTVLELDDLVSFEPAGLGQLLLRREQAPAQIVQLRCL